MAKSYDEILALTQQMPIPTPWDREVFVANIARLRGRPIRLFPVDTAALADSPCGLWLSRADDDVIVHEAGTSEYHIDQIVCHEIGHMILGHGTAQGLEPDPDQQTALYREFLPDLDIEAVSTVLTRRQCTDDQERDAELFASVLAVTAAENESAQSMMRSIFFHQR